MKASTFVILAAAGIGTLYVLTKLPVAKPTKRRRRQLRSDVDWRFGEGGFTTPESRQKAKLRSVYRIGYEQARREEREKKKGRRRYKPLA